MLSSTVRRLTQKGVALVVVLLILVVLVMLAGTAAVLGTSTQTLSIKAQQEAVLLHVADGGLQELMDKVNQNIYYGTSASPPTMNTTVNAGEPGRARAYTVSMPGREMALTDYWWTFDAAAEPYSYSTNNLRGTDNIYRPDGLVVPPESMLAIISAYDKGQVAAMKPEARPLRIAAIVTDRWDDGIAADSTININHSVVKDVGYSEKPPSVDARVRSNQPNPSPNDYTVCIEKGNSVKQGKVFGDVFSCLNATTIEPYPPLSTWENHPNSPPVELPNIPIDTMVDNAFNTTLPANQCIGDEVTCNSSADGLLLEFTITTTTTYVDTSGKKPKTVTNTTTTTNNISLPADIYVWVKGDKGLIFNGGADLSRGARLFVKGDVTINGRLVSGPTTYIFTTGNATIDGNSTTKNTHILATTDIRINGDSDLDGFLYTRKGDIRVTGGGKGATITGVMIARDDDRNDGPTLGKIDVSGYDVTTKLEYLTEFRKQFPNVLWRRLYTIAWWRLQ